MPNFKQVFLLDAQGHGGGGNYVEKIARMLAEGTLSHGQLQILNIDHDDWCGSLHGASCNCDPDIYPRKPD